MAFTIKVNGVDLTAVLTVTRRCCGCFETSSA